MRGSSLLFRSVQRFDLLAVMQQNYCAGVKDLKIQNTEKHSAKKLISFQIKTRLELKNKG